MARRSGRITNRRIYCRWVRSHSRWRNASDPFAKGDNEGNAAGGAASLTFAQSTIDFSAMVSTARGRRCPRPTARKSCPGGLMRPDYRGGPRAGNEVVVRSFQDATTISR
jgi:hypothetical protein